MAVAVHKKSSSKKHGRIKLNPKARSAKGTSVKPGKVGDLRQRLKLKQAVFARLLPVSLRTLATLESGAPPTEGVARRLHELERLTNALAEVMTKESLGPWLLHPNEAFDGLKPLEVIDRGESDRIWEMIYFLRAGAPS